MNFDENEPQSGREERFVADGDEGLHALQRAYSVTFGWGDGF
ncbi:MULTISPECIES: hypothetical protein [unclassified Streptomyces]|nr:MULTISPECIES: hypothetical protein [unclassified Streptomyces]SCF95171.1 hypothetical protein GA0115259_105479 [Streptomyces sp. MnatMP-M17]